MPYKLRKIPNQDCYRVYNRRTKRVFAKCSSLVNARRQMRLLNAIEYSDFVPQGAKNRTRARTNKSKRTTKRQAKN